MSSPEMYGESKSVDLLMRLFCFEENFGEISQQSAILRDAHLHEHRKCLKIWDVVV